MPYLLGGEKFHLPPGQRDLRVTRSLRLAVRRRDDAWMVIAPRGSTVKLEMAGEGPVTTPIGL